MLVFVCVGGTCVQWLSVEVEEQLALSCLEAGACFCHAKFLRTALGFLGNFPVSICHHTVGALGLQTHACRVFRQVPRPASKP